MSEKELKYVPEGQLVRMSIGAMAELASRELSKRPFEERLTLAEMIEGDAGLRASVDFASGTLSFFLDLDGELVHLFTLEAASPETLTTDNALLH